MPGVCFWLLNLIIYIFAYLNLNFIAMKIITIIDPLDEDDGICEYCGELDELRPYGKNGANICFDCGMLDEAEAVRQFDKRLSPGKISEDQNN